MRKATILESFKNAARGVTWILQNERNFQIEIGGLFINIFLIFYLNLTSQEAAIILLTSFAVLSLEMLNTSVEKICDFIQPKTDVRIKLIKDVAAGSVLVMTIAALIIALIIYPKYLF